MHVKNGGHAVRRRVPKSFKIGPSLSFYGTKCLFKIWANESIKQEFSAMGRKQNINLAEHSHECFIRRRIQVHKINFTKNSSFTEDRVNTDNTVSLLNT